VRPAPRNGFDLLRLGAAALVLVDHSYLLTGHVQPGVAIGDRVMMMGALGVCVFFVLSGHLVTDSWLRHPALAPFVLKRVRRIWPALTAAVVMTALVLGPLLTSLSLPRYFSSSGTWDYIATVTLAPVRYGLPGVLLYNPLPGVVNGALWTLPIEVLLYCCLALLGFAGILRLRWFPVLAAAGALLCSSTLPNTHQVDLTVLVACFCLGAATRTVPLTFRRHEVLVAGAALVGGLVAGWLPLALVGFAYLLVAVGRRPVGRVGRVIGLGDPSYGMYIYGYPVQQALVAAGLRAVPSLMAVSLVVVPALGYLSWHVLEQPVLRGGRGQAVRPVRSTPSRFSRSARSAALS
jgi:peptidoglycan/LPS O-acetylase OafA/YrhL